MLPTGNAEMGGSPEPFAFMLMDTALAAIGFSASASVHVAM